MKKSLKIAGVSALAVLGLASLAACGETKTTSQTIDTRNSAKAAGVLDISVNNNSSSKKSGVTYQGSARTVGYADISLKDGDVLPTWKCFAEKLQTFNREQDEVKTSSVEIKGANDFSQKSYKEDFDNIYLGNAGFTYNNANIDLVMGDGTYFNKAITNELLEPISKHLNVMPHFAQWVENNPAIWKSMKYTDGEVYFTPYFDGLNSIEKMQLFNVEYVAKLLDKDGEYDTNAARAVTSVYTATVTDGDQVLDVVGNDGKKTSFTAHFSTANNPVAKQAGTKNGAELVAALKEGLRAEYKDAFDKGIYTKLSEVFTGEKACYNTDDLIALLRACKANPVYLTGEDQEMRPIAPRSAEDKRTIDLTCLISLWGYRGMDSENGKLYIDATGTLQDARTQEGTYQGLNYLHQLYEEGLFVTNYTSDPSGAASGKGEWRKKGIETGTTVMLYDYNATSSPFNKDAVGNSTSKSNLQPILPPVVKWSADKDLNYQATENGTITNLKGRYFHFSESNRALKSGGWAVPASSDNKESAYALMDYLFTKEGAYIQDFGPDNGKYWSLATSSDSDAKKAAIATVNGGESPIITEGLMDDILHNAEGLDWNNYMRCIVGSTQGIGHTREDSLDYQVTVSESSQNGLSNIKKAISAGAMILAQTGVNEGSSKFFMSVPQTINLTPGQLADQKTSDAANKMTTIWDSSKKGCPIVSWIINGSSTISAQYSTYEAFKTSWNDVDFVSIKSYRTQCISLDLI